MNWLTKARRTVGKRFFGIPGDLPFGYANPLGVPAEKNSREVLGEYTGIVYACISAIAEGFAAAETRLYKKGKTDEDRKPITSHEFLTLLKNPNPDQSAYEFDEALQSFMEMVGEIFIYFALGEKTGRPKEMYLIRPDRMRLVIDKEGKVVAYKLMKNGIEGILLAPEEIYHYKSFNPNNPYRGIGTLQAAMVYVETEKFAAKFTRNFLYNNATPAGILQLGKDVGKEGYLEFKRRWAEQVGGVENAGNIAVIRGAGAEFTKIGLSLGDIDLKALRNLSEESIMRMFKVPKPILATSDDVGLGRASIETLEYIYMKRTIDPKLTRADGMWQRVADRFWPKDNLEVDHSNVIPADKEFELKRKEVGVDKWISADEARVEEGMNPIGATQLFRPINLVPLEVSTEQKKKTYTLGVKKGLVAPAKKEEEQEAQAFDFDVTDKSDSAPHEIFRKNTVERIGSLYELKTRKAISAYLDDQKAKVIARFADKSVTAKSLEDGLDEAEENKALVAALIPIMGALALACGTEALDFVGSDLVFEMTPNLEAMLKAHLEKMSYKFNDDTITKLAKTLSEGFANGESNTQMRKRIDVVYQEAKTFRNSRVARSEAHWLATNSTEWGYMQSEYVSYKKWYTNPGACEFCMSMDGRIEAVGHKFLAKGSEIKATNDKGNEVSFIADYEAIENAHLHPNCRCQILPLDGNKSAGSLSLHAVEKKDIAIDSMIEDKVDDALKSFGAKADAKLAKVTKDIDSKVEKLNEILEDEESSEEKDNQSEA
jgi:HK97 family phage portal protein